MAGSQRLSQTKKWVPRAQAAAAQNKKVLVVEGVADQAVLMAWLEKDLGPEWTNRVHLEIAGNRSELLGGLLWLRDNQDPAQSAVFGLADRDEWHPADVAQQQALSPTLLVNLQRHSLESYFCDPDELKQIFTSQEAETGRNGLTPAFRELHLQLMAALPDYVAHWALCHVTQRANERIRDDAEYPGFFRNRCPLPSDADIQTKLAEWSGILDSRVLFADFVALRNSCFQRPLAEQFRGCIESKLFFGTTVVNGQHGLNRIKTQSKEDWLVQLARWSPAMPADLRLILAPVLT